eukprot:TRINITY_DN2839_c0_g1_i2.p1 TRINITY_DN2839_c0_g1~~TRINITY_DN2839_c0_g1_i2.p1  ORF type:complete len:416 (+),score=46.78 TRINITY_DN2839_c0_g1_i2:71-1318(+)
MADQEARIEQLLTTMQAAILSSNQMQATLVASLEAQERANSQRFANMDQTVQRIRVTNANARPMPAVQTQKHEQAAEDDEDDEPNDEEILLLEHPVKAIRANPKPCIMAAGMAVVSLIAIVVTSVVGISRAYGDIIVTFYLIWIFFTALAMWATFMLYIRQQRIAKWSRWSLVQGLFCMCFLIILPLVCVLVDFEAISASKFGAARISVDTSSAIPAGEVFRFPISSVPCCRSMRINSFHPSDVASFDNTTNEVVGIMPQNSTAVACTAICPIFGTDNAINCQTFWLIASRNGTRVPSTARIAADDEAHVILSLVTMLCMVATACCGALLAEIIPRARRLTASLVALMVAVMMTCTCFVVVGSCGLIPFIPVYVVLPVAAALQLVVCVVMIRQKTRDTSWAFLGLAVKKAEDDDL